MIKHRKEKVVRIMNKKLKIELRSPLTAGSGYSFAGIIDSDICYDEYGIPFIPGKRIKGCMRDTAEYIVSAVLDHSAGELFGRKGNNDICGITVGNAYIEDYQQIKDEIRAAEKDKDLGGMVTPQAVLDEFTDVKAQTRMKDGVAEDNSLRFTRMVKEYSPLNNGRLVFTADISFDDELESDIEKIVKGLRNIGLMRNRGMGSVDCTLQDNEESQKNEAAGSSVGDLAVIEYTLTNIAPLMISTDNDAESIKYIPGQNVLGALAGRYLKRKGTSADDDEFKDLFLNGKTVFTNVYPSLDGEVYYPSPQFVNKLKKTGKLVNVELLGSHEQKGNDDEEYVPEFGNQPKRLTEKFTAIRKDASKYSFGIHDVKMQIIYHNNKRDKKDDGSTFGLYSQQAVSEGQQFAGRVIVPSEYAEDVYGMLTENDLYFGKSRTAQYGRCSGKAAIKAVNEETDTINIRQGDALLVTLLSDGIFCNDSGYTVDTEEVKKILSGSLGINAEASDEYRSIVETRKVFGYNYKWNLRKSPVPAVRAGSTYYLKAGCDAVVPEECFVGERNLEGYGQIRVFKAGDLGYKLDSFDNSEAAEYTCGTENVRSLIKDIIVAAISDHCKNTLLGRGYKLRVTKSKRGRVTLMLAESIDRYPKDNQWKDRKDDFLKRIASIDDPHDEKEINEYLKNTIFDGTDNINHDIYSVSIGSGNDKSAIDPRDMLKEKLGYSDKEIAEMLAPLWSDILMTLLVHEKYQAKKEGE